MTPHLKLTEPPHVFLFQVWGSIRGWSAQQKEDLEAYLHVARGGMDGTRLVPGMPVFVETTVMGRTPKKSVVRWAVVCEGEPTDEEHIFVGSSGDVLEVALDDVQPVQVRASIGPRRLQCLKKLVGQRIVPIVPTVREKRLRL